MKFCCRRQQFCGILHFVSFHTPSSHHIFFLHSRNVCRKIATLSLRLHKQSSPQNEMNSGFLFLRSPPTFILSLFYPHTFSYYLPFTLHFRNFLRWFVSLVICKFFFGVLLFVLLAGLRGVWVTFNLIALNCWLRIRRALFAGCGWCDCIFFLFLCFGLETLWFR